jgi:hypothetical protein
VGRRRPLRYARLEGERITPFHAGMSITTIRCDVPARRGAFAVGVRTLAHDRMTALHISVRIANLRGAAPARCGASADQRRVVAGGAGG